MKIRDDYEQRTQGYRRFYDFMLWTIKHTEKFPRYHRYSLGIAIENRLQKLLELLLRAKYSRDKTEVLNEANSEPQQQQPRQPEQQQRVSCCPALSIDIDNQARNRTVYRLSERGFGSPGSIPELWFSEVCCRAEFTLYGRVGLVGFTPNVPSG